MKKLFTILLVITMFALFSVNVNAQLTVVAPGLETLATLTHIDQIIYYIQSVAQMADSVMNGYNQLQTTIRMYEMAVKNLNGITDVRSFDDFMSWYNRQLYLERQTENKFKNIGVKIGGENYKLADIQEIPDAMKENYVDYWEKEFTDEQRRQMWLNLGLTSANYTYIQTWKTREKNLIKSILTKRETLNEEYNKEIMDRLADDKNRTDSDKMGEKELLSMLVEESIANNKKLNDIAMDMAEANEWQLSRYEQSKAPPNPPMLSESWNTSFFGPITE